MSADISPAAVVLETRLEDANIPNVQAINNRRQQSGMLTLWNEPSLTAVNKHQNDNNFLTVDPSSSSEAYEREREQVAFLAAVELLNGVKTEENFRKSSDPGLHQRSLELSRKSSKKRCLSDTIGTKVTLTLLENDGSLVRVDSGIVETCSSRPLELSSLEQTPLSMSDGESSPPIVSKVNHHNINKSLYMKRAGSFDERVIRQLNVEDDTSSHHSAASSGSKYRRVPITKHPSQCSMGGSSTSFSSLCECASNTSIATDILSGLGFDDFDNPELIPDRFIPNDIDYAKPSSMKEAAMLVSCTPNVYDHTNCSLSQSNTPSTMAALAPTSSDYDYLPLGATADNFLPSKVNRSQSPPPSPPSFVPNAPIAQHRFVDPCIDRKYSVYALINPTLETVPEETASDLSPSPRWLSPRVSLDHSYMDLSMSHLGASLAVANRKRSLPNRDGYRLSVDSMISEQESTVYFSVTSYDDDIAKEVDEAAPPPLPLEDVTVPRRRRRGVHGAPPELLSWLQTNPIHEEDGVEEPWPFNEQLRLRRSLTEIQQRRSRTSSSNTIGDRSLSPPPFHDPLAGFFPRRFSINGPLVPQMYPSELRRLSLPSNSSFHHYNTPVPEEDEVDITDSNTKSSDIVRKTSVKLPPGMTREEALEYKHDATILKSEVEDMKTKLYNSEKVIKNLEEGYKRKFSDTQEWLQSELWMKDHHCRELEEIVESQRRELAQHQQNFQIKVARTREEIKEVKDAEIKELHRKMKQKEQEHKDDMIRLQEECRQLKLKETHLLKKISQQGIKNDNDDLQREVIKLKEQLRKDKDILSAVIKQKDTEIKQIRTKGQLDKEEALKQLKHHLVKLHDIQISSIKQQMIKASTSEFTVNKVISSGQTPNKLELKKLRCQTERQELEVKKMQDIINELQYKLRILHEEHLKLERKLTEEIKGLH